MKIAFVTTNHGREKILQIYLEGIDRLRGQTDVDIESIVVGEDNAITGFYDCIHIPYKNEPLTEKFNVGCQVARDIDADYVMIMGSDNILSIEVLNEMMSHPESNFLAPRDIYFLAVDGEFKGQAIYILSSVIGCSRLLRRDLLDKVDWTPWNRESMKAIDGIMYRHMQPHFINPYVFVAKDFGGKIVDIKSSENINTFDRWKAMARVPLEESLSFISDKEREMLNNLLHIKQ